MAQNRHTDEISISCYLRDLRKTKPVSKEREKELFERIRKGDVRSKNELLSANLRFVVSVALKYQNQGMPVSDLINEGNLGLIRAIDSFDETRNLKFISYAVWWIRQSIINALAEQSRVTRIPINKANVLSRLRPSMEKLEQELGRMPSAEEVAYDLRISNEEMRDVVDIQKDALSFDTRLRDNADACLFDLIGTDDPAIADFEDRESRAKVLDAVLGTLEKREADILKLYFGIGCESGYNLEQIGRKFNISKERIRQIKENAFKKLQNFKKSRAFSQDLCMCLS